MWGPGKVNSNPVQDRITGKLQEADLPTTVVCFLGININPDCLVSRMARWSPRPLQQGEKKGGGEADLLPQGHQTV